MLSFSAFTDKTLWENLHDINSDWRNHKNKKYQSFNFNISVRSSVLFIISYTMFLYGFFLILKKFRHFCKSLHGDTR